MIDTGGGGGGGGGGEGGKSPPPLFVATTLHYYAMFSAINVYTSASAHFINMFPPLAKNPVSIPGAWEG